MRAAIGAEALRQRLEERDARPGGQLGIAVENFARQRDAGGFAAPGQQILAQLDQALGARRGVTAPVARRVEQRAAALGDGLQQFAEEGGIHSVPSRTVRCTEYARNAGLATCYDVAAASGFITTNVARFAPTAFRMAASNTRLAQV